MRTLLTILICLMLSVVSLAADIHNNGTTGDWHDPDEWDLGRRPTYTDDVYIEYSLDVNNPGVLALGKTLEVSDGATLNLRSTLVIMEDIFLGLNLRDSGGISVLFGGFGYCEKVYIGDDGDGSLNILSPDGIFTATDFVQINKGIVSVDAGEIRTPNVKISPGSLLTMTNNGVITW